MQNPERLATKQDLSDMYTRILPYLNKSVDAGFTPVGSVIAIMGVTSPANYLACDGQIVNVADYPELANYFYQQFGSKNKFGGDGTTTFGIPDLRGEFLRGTGTNSHTKQGNGADVGVHQDSTCVDGNMQSVNSKVIRVGSTTEWAHGVLNPDSNYRITGFSQFFGTSAEKQASDAYDLKTVRPTNTSILWCIATKDIYLNPSMDYSTSEKVVGKWIDGKTLYQKTIETTMPTTSTDGVNATKYVDLGIAIDKCMIVSGYQDYGGVMYPIPNYFLANDVNFFVNYTIRNNSYATNANTLGITQNRIAWNNNSVVVTIQYTKVSS